MPYQGQTYRLLCNGGWNNNPNFDIQMPGSMYDILNINLHRDGMETRGGVQKVNTTPIADVPRIMGLYQFRKKNGNEFIITGTEDGKIQKDYNAELKVGLAHNNYFNFTVFNDNLYICNGANVPEKWDGTSEATTSLTDIPTDWQGSNFPKHIIKHGKGVSERLWAYGCLNNPERIYISKNGSDDFSDLEVIILSIETGDGYGIMGMMEFGDRVICFGKKKAYIINDESVDASNWGYADVQWEGGTAHERLIVKTPNDIICMTDDGEIYSVRAVESYGDYESASLTRGVHIDKWIKENVNLGLIEKFSVIYDPILRAVRFFVVRNEYPEVDTCLLFFVDKGLTNGWSKHIYKTDLISCAGVIRSSLGRNKIYAGGHVGHVYELEHETASDDGDSYWSGFTTPYMAFENSRFQKRYDGNWITVIPYGTETLNINVNIDGHPLAEGSYLVDENGDYIGDENENRIVGDGYKSWSVTTEGSGDLEDLSHGIDGIGKRIQQEVYNNTVNEKFYITQMLIDFQPLGADSHG